jgi:nucleoside-diphosphate kinase
MSARNDETWIFIVEWYDPLPRLKKVYLLRYFVQQHQVEMVDMKSKKMFLKKSPCTEETTPEDFAIGNRVCQD